MPTTGMRSPLEGMTRWMSVCADGSPADARREAPATARTPLSRLRRVVSMRSVLGPPDQLPEQCVEADADAYIAIPVVVPVPAHQWLHVPEQPPALAGPSGKDARLVVGDLGLVFFLGLGQQANPEAFADIAALGVLGRTPQFELFGHVCVRQGLCPLHLVPVGEPFAVRGRAKHVAPEPAIKGSRRGGSQSFVGPYEQLCVGVEVPLAELVVIAPFHRREQGGWNVDAHADVEINVPAQLIAYAGAQPGILASRTRRLVHRLAGDEQAQPPLDVGHLDLYVELGFQGEIETITAIQRLDVQAET